MCSCVYRFCLYLTLCSMVAGVSTNQNLDHELNNIGYQSEFHEVITADNYILKLHHIHSKKGNGATTKKRGPVFLQHGIFSSSYDWIISLSNKSLPLLLANDGYDVWLGNSRGNALSRGHTKLSPDDNKFWNFSFHEMGTLDLPAVIDYILNTTNEPELYYIGHGMGTTMFYVLCSEKPEYNKKIITMFSLAPVAFLKNAKSPITFFALFWKFSLKWDIMFGTGKFLPHYLIKNALELACKILYISKQERETFCKNNLFIICGPISANIDTTLLDTLGSQTQSDASAKTLVHFVQEINSGDFRQFDYGKNNPSMYNGSTEPPSYNLTKVKAPMFLLYGDNDYLANIDDVKQLIKSLNHVVFESNVKYLKTNHLDLLFWNDADIPVLKAINDIDKYHYLKNEQELLPKKYRPFDHALEKEKKKESNFIKSILPSNGNGIDFIEMGIKVIINSLYVTILLVFVGPDTLDNYYFGMFNSTN